MAGLTATGVVRSRPAWWMYALAAPFIAYYALLLYSDLTRPEPAGFVLGMQGTELVVREVAPVSPAARAGLDVGDRMLAANAHPIGSRLDWLGVEMNWRTREPLHLDVARDGSRRLVALVLDRAPRRYWTTAAGATLVGARSVQLVTLALALIVMFKRPGDRSALAGAWVLATLAVYSIVWPYQIAATWRGLPAPIGLMLFIPFASSLAIAAVLTTFFATFPRTFFRSQWAWLAVWAPMAAVLALQLQFAGRVVYRPEDVHGFVDWTPLSTGVTAGYTAAALALLVLGYRRLTDVTERRRVRVLVVGASVGLLSALPVVAGYWGRSEASLDSSIFGSPTVALGSTLALALPVSFAYAILRHRLFDVRLIVRLGLQYALARRVLVSIVPGLAVMFLADLWIHRQIPFADIARARGWVYVVLALFALIARLRRNEWLDGLDRRFFRERLNAQRLLRGIGDDIRAANGLSEVAPRIVTAIEAALHPTFAALLLRDAHEALFRAIAPAPPSAALEPLSSESKTVGMLRWLQKPLQLPTDERAWLFRQFPQEEVDAHRRSGIELFVPVRLGASATEALFVLGPRRSEEPYSAEDEDLLMAIADSLALLLDRAPSAPPEREAFEECATCGACYDFGQCRCVLDGTPLTVASSPRRLGGRYRLDRRVGRGGMGTVYAALDTALDRPVAAKLLREDFLDPTAAERFQSEARLAAALAHPNVVTIHDTGVTAAGRVYFIMELLAGLTLREELKRTGPLPPARVRRIVRGISAAVDAAHRHHMVHRDLKPENIFLCRNDTGEIPKVLDFGLAKSLDAVGSTTILTTPGVVAGTPQYMAPEHLSGDEPSPDWDLWALAVMAFEMITGALPVAVTPGSQHHVEQLSAGLQKLFARALSVNPLERPTTAEEFAAELDRELMGHERSS